MVHLNLSDMHMIEAVIGVIICILLLAGVSQMFNQDQLGGALGSSGLISYSGLDFFSDLSLSSRISHVNWGTLEPGGSSSVDLVIYNFESSPLILYLSSEKWEPSAAQQFLDLSWNYSGDPLQSHEAVEISFVLSVSEDILGIDSFSFDVVVMA